VTVGALIRWFPRDELPSLVRFTVNAVRRAGHAPLS
jgi:hypothetical protein